jgi:threonine/homoserine/homoserine lactone efflux protein
VVKEVTIRLVGGLYLAYISFEKSCGTCGDEKETAKGGGTKRLPREKHG